MTFGLDGYELTARIRTEEAGAARIPIIALTANALKEEATRRKAAGIDAYVTKPVQMAMLDNTPKKWLGPRVPGSVDPEPAGYARSTLPA